MKTYIVELTTEERSQLKEVINQNKLSKHLSPASVKLILQYNQPGMMLR